MHTQAELAFDLIDRLHKSLRISGMSATSLSFALGVHRNTVNNYLSGKTHPDRRTLIAWAQVTGVPVAWIEHGDAPEPSPGPGLPSDHGGSVKAVKALAASKRSRRATTTDRYHSAALAA